MGGHSAGRLRLMRNARHVATASNYLLRYCTYKSASREGEQSELFSQVSLENSTIQRYVSPHLDVRCGIELYQYVPRGVGIIDSFQFLAEFCGIQMEGREKVQQSCEAVIGAHRRSSQRV